MLQQTQVNTVIPYYIRFIKRFPGIKTLARAREDSVLSHWSGLGYYSRARNLHKAAKRVMNEFKGIFPKDFKDIIALPGIGRSTAAAISVFSFGKDEAILDGNVKRILARYFGIDTNLGNIATEKNMWSKARGLLPKKDLAAYTQGLMDLGAAVCTRFNPDCPDCPLKKRCYALKHKRVDRLPAVQKRKPLPVKKTCMLIFKHKDKVLLVKRPAKGVWANLFSLPEMVPGKDIRQYCKNKFKIKTGRIQKLPDLQHTFTHFRLIIHPLLLPVCNLHWKRHAGPGQKAHFKPAHHPLGMPLPLQRFYPGVQPLLGPVLSQGDFHAG
jgi:A/G-specific adenine glycosylase